MSKQTYPVIEMAGFNYQLQIQGEDILIVNTNREVVDNVFQFDKIWIGGFTEMRGMILDKHKWSHGHSEEVEIQAYEIMGYWLKFGGYWLEVADVIEDAEYINFI